MTLRLCAIAMLLLLTACVNPALSDGGGPTQAQRLYDQAVRPAMAMTQFH